MAAHGARLTVVMSAMVMTVMCRFLVADLRRRGCMPLMMGSIMDMMVILPRRRRMFPGRVNRR